MAKLLRFSTEATQKLLEGVNTITEAVAATLGPKGNNVAIERKWGAPTVLHDGVSVAKEVDLDDPFANIGAQLMKEAAIRTNDTAGDGTTTATILAQAIVTGALKNIAAGANAMMLRKGIEQAKESLVMELHQMAKPIKTPEEIKQVATISAQDEEIGGLIATAIDKLGRDSIITVEESGGTQLSIEYKEGMEFDRGYISHYFVTNGALSVAELENVYMLITDKKLSSTADIVPFVTKFAEDKERQGNNLVIIAENVETDALAFFVLNKIKGTLPSLCIQAPGYGASRKAMLEDMAVLTGGRVISEEAGETLENVTLADLGRARKITATKDSTLIIDGGGTEEAITERIKTLETQLQNPDLGEFDREKITERKAKLSSGIAVINVGANSEPEMREKKERCIDAINATKSAIEEGIVPGGEVALIRAARKVKIDPWMNDVSVGAALILEAVKKPFERLMENSGYNAGRMFAKLENELGKSNMGIDVMDGEIKDLVKAGIIDPVKVTRSALENAVSVAIMVMTTNVLIVDKPEPEKQPNKDPLYD